MNLPIQLIQLAAVVLVVTLAIETVQWLIIFRKPQFQSLKKRLTLQRDKIDEISTAKVAKSAKEKKQGRLKAQATNENTKIFSSINFWTKAVGALFMFVTYRLVARWLNNIAIAKLPFEPQGIFKKLTHRQLDGTDWTAASVTFMFTLCTMSLKANLTQWLQWGPDRSMTLYSKPSPQQLVLLNRRLLVDTSSFGLYRS